MEITGSIVKVGRLEEGGNTVFAFTVMKSKGGLASGPQYYAAVFIARTDPRTTSDMMLRLALAQEDKRFKISIEGESEPPTGRNVDDWKLRVSVLAVEPEPVLEDKFLRD